jgi:hypothetical protein
MSPIDGESYSSAVMYGDGCGEQQSYRDERHDLRSGHKPVLHRLLSCELLRLSDHPPAP